MKILDLAYYLINNYTDKSPDGITPLKLQKLLYYIYVWNIVEDKKILETEFLKWEHGPVNKLIYDNFKKYGKNQIPSNEYPEVEISQEGKNFIDFIAANYAQFSAITLSAMTHQDAPWKETKKDEQISTESIKSFYSKLNFAKNFPIDYEKPFYPVETDSHYSFILDFSKEDEAHNSSYKSYKHYSDLVKKVQNESKESLKFKSFSNIMKLLTSKN